jgi:vancomycin permeability regulator SanA
MIHLHPVSRGMALTIGLFCLANIIGEQVVAGFDANIWWIDLRMLPRGLASALLVTSGLLLMAFTLWPAMPAWRAFATRSVVSLLCLFAVINAVTFYRLKFDGSLYSSPWLPFSAFVAGTLLVMLHGMSIQKPADSGWHQTGLISMTTLCLAFILPFTQMFLFGKTDYRRPADVALVFGARTYADGRASLALSDRVQTGIDLYHQGFVKYLVVSGGPGDGAFHETDTMRRLAQEAGVPDEAIIIDRAGLNTNASIRNTAEILKSRGLQSLIAVSHFYHLPRIKLSSARGCDVPVYTVPARESRTLNALPYYLAREVAAIWAYYLMIK